MLHKLLLPTAVALTTAAFALTESPRRVTSTRSAVFAPDTVGAYTTAQAERGLAVFKKVCSECHEPQDFTNADFHGEWNGRSLFDLYENVRTTMPDETPGTLTQQQYEDVLAYMLQLNKAPTGASEFRADSASAKAILLKLPVTSSSLR
jgi:mono/diheme cytochrome c family protein